MEKKKRKGDKLKGMEYWKKWCGSPATRKQENLGPTTSLHADNKIVITSEPSTSFTVSNVETESVVSPAPCFIPTTTDPSLSLEPTSSSTSSSVTSSSHSSKLDVGFYATEDNIENEYLKAQILKEPWTPPQDYKFPISTKRNLRFQMKWMERFPWLAYSEYKSGAYCRICVVMRRSLDEGKGGHQRVGQLVTDPFCKWKNALEIFETHAKSGYHKRNLELADNFLKVMSSQVVSVDEQLSSERKRQQQENRKKLIPIVKGIIFCGKQGIPLRGKTDSGRIHVTPESEQPLQNEGNFRALLRYAAESGDKDLSEHLITSQKNALYTSPQIQNEIIDICGEIIQHKIINEVKEAIFFSILADETTDIARMEQVSLCLRYVDSKDAKQHKVKEMFLEYIPTVDVTGSGLANLIITALKKHGLDCSHVVGQGYDGAAAMSGYLHGAQAFIRQDCPLALYVHCSAHSLNLAIADSCSQAEVRNCVGIVQSVGSYFRHSAQRTAVLKEKIRDLLPADHQKSLLAMCETRWVHKHEAVIRFKEIYSAIVHALEELQSSHNKETSQQAVQMLNTLRSSNFVMCLVILQKVMSYTLSLSKQLQTVNADLITAFSHVDNVINALQLLRDKVDEEYLHLYEEAKVLLEENGGILLMPRIVGRQLNRSYIPASDISTYYKLNLFIPFLDHTIQQLIERFIKHRKVVSALSCVLPSNFATSCEIEEAFCMYSTVLPEKCSSVVKAELEVWKAAMTLTSPIPKSALECLDNCDQKLYPNIYTLLQILATIPVSTATPERTFSSLRRLKNYLRNTTSENRLNGLALMNIHYMIEIDANEVVDIFKKKNRRLIL
ncbi:52 kDa repressor of the inhibitor of the protein kinase-like [Amyelois transitella]|uniref:52 kDa repressor of the inhibitor of the protein kinase-like n=1 Tax=Amyelois transitella TaxID=680683 RepID=UPI00298F5616|nr:52 kDa repressor of the inhibitor of the protein kinase-like [Amyelois transitella]